MANSAHGACYATVVCIANTDGHIRRKGRRMIAVYGAHGFIGRHIVRRLAGRGTPLRAVSRRFDRDFVGALPSWVDVQIADLAAPLPMAASLQDVDTVLQLVSDSTPGLRNDNIVPDIEVNVVPHVAFLEMCIRNGVRRYIFLSSGGTVYGPGVPTPTSEVCPTRPINSHGLTKLVVEKYIEMHGQVNGLDYVILRAANPFGPGQIFRKGQGLIPALLDRQERGQAVRVFGDGSAMRDYLYIDDLIDAIEASVALPGQPQHVLNVGSGETRSVLEVIAALKAATGRHFELEYVGVRNTDVDVVCLDVSRAAEVLGWRPSTPFDDGIQRTVEARAARA